MKVILLLIFHTLLNCTSYLVDQIHHFNLLLHNLTKQPLYKDFVASKCQCLAYTISLPIMLALCLMHLPSHYAQNDASIFAQANYLQNTRL